MYSLSTVEKSQVVERTCRNDHENNLSEINSYRDVKRVEKILGTRQKLISGIYNSIKFEINL